jgi:adenylate kinase family enzyme
LSRIAVIGATGAGKTTLAHNIAQRLGYRHIEMDSLHWEPHWQVIHLRSPRETAEWLRKI